MPWLYSVSSGTPPNYTWTGLNTLNQHASAVGGVPANASITQLKVFAAGHSGSVATRLVLWDDDSPWQVLRQSTSFTMASGTETPGGQQWHTKSITPRKMAGGTYWVGLYRNPSGGHIAGTANSNTSYRKTNTAGWPSVSSMSGYATQSKEFYVGLFYITAPAAVSSVGVSRISDSKMSLSWTKNSSSNQPYTYQIIERYDNVTGSYYRIAKLSGSPSSYNDTSTKDDRTYRYRIKTYNESGYSSYAYSSYINTTPDAPSNVVATRSGSTVVLTWTDNASMEDQFRIQKRESTDEGETWGSWGSDVTPTANETEYIDSSPYGYGQYRIRSEETSQSLWYDYVESNEVVTIVEPNAPTLLDPIGSNNMDGDDAYTFSWQHNPVDGTDQSKFSLQHRVEGGSFPGTPQLNEVASTFEYYEFAASTFTNGNTYEWQVKTWGQHANSSDWSSIATFNAVSKPVGTITTPNGIDDYGYSLLTLTWLYSQSEGNGQAQYIAKLFDENDNLLESRQIYSPVSDGSSGECIFDYELENATDYKCTLQVQSDDGTWGVETDVEFTTDFYVPSTPVIVVNNENDGIVTIEIENPSPTGDELTADHNNLYRSIDGENYELVYEDIEPNTSITDYLPNVGGDTYYYVNAVSTTPSVAKSNIEQITQTLQGHYFLNGGNNYENYIDIYGDILFSDSNQKDTVLKQFEGRTYPVKYTGDSIQRLVTLQGDVLISDYSTVKTITESTNCFYRDYKGNYFKCSINAPQHDKKDVYAHQFKCIIQRIEDDDDV